MSSEILPLIDFSKVKKKRKVEAENTDELDLEDVVLTKKKGKKKNKEKKK